MDAAAVTLLLSALPQSDADPSLFLRRSNPPFHTFENLSPRSRAHSIASSLSTASSSRSNYAEDTRDSSAHARPSDKYASAALYPGADGSGFIVEVPGSGQWPVSWNSLMELLLNPQSTAALPQGHPIAEAAAVLSVRLRRDHSLLQTCIGTVSDDLHSLSFDGVPPAPLPSADQHHFPLASAARYSPEYLPPDQSLPPAVDPTSASTGLPAKYASTLSTPRQPTFVSPDTLLSSCQFQSEPYLPFSTTHSFTPHSTSNPRPPPSTHVHPDSHSRPPSLRRGEIEQECSLSRRENLRHAALPYARPSSQAHHHSHLSTSSLRAFAGANGSMSTGVESYASSAASSESRRSHSRTQSLSTRSTISDPDPKPKQRPLRALNRNVERYCWSKNKGQLFRVPSGTDASEVFEKAEDGKVPMEVLTFWPGSYYKVTLDDLEILPCDNNRRVNEWLKGQTCEASCAFRIEGKRPSVIRQHIVSCKVRAAKFVNGDPLKRLCQLQLDAQYKPAMTNKPRRASQPPDHRRSADWADIPPAYNSDAEDYNVDRRSIISFGSSLGDPDGAGTKPSTGCSAALLCEGEGNSEQAFQAFIASSSSTSGDPSSQALGPGGMLPIVEGSWLVGYGLSVPTGQQAQFSHGTVVDSSATTAIPSSFLSMDE
ncbi:hypothetical protein JCM5296_002038 [Sporobolomyces johnsonii]